MKEDQVTRTIQSLAWAFSAAVAAVLMWGVMWGHAADASEHGISFVPGSVEAKLHEPVGLSSSPSGLTDDSYWQPYLQAVSDAPFVTQAGAGADSTVVFDFDQPLVEDARDVVTELPPGFLGNPTSTPYCQRDRFLNADLGCPIDSQVGFAMIHGDISAVGGLRHTSAVYNLPPPAGSPASFGAIVYGVPINLVADVRSDGDFGVTITAVDAAARADISWFGAIVTIWGNPGHPNHNPLRYDWDSQQYGTSAENPTGKAFLRSPTRCDGGNLNTSLRARSWQNPARWITGVGVAPALTGCEILEFSPSLQARPTTNLADSPSGLDVHMQIPQSEDAEGVATAHLRRAAVRLPAGFTLNPSGANGLRSCSPSRIGLVSRAGVAPGRFNRSEPRCPAASKIADARLETPVLEEDMRGEVFLADQRRNPFGSDYAVYLVLRNTDRGLLFKFAGEVKTNPRTGRVETVFPQNPQLPFSDLELDFFGGAAAPLATPPVCGQYQTTSSLTPWSHPHSGPPATPSDSYQVSRRPGGGPCATSRGNRPFQPTLQAGSASAVAGAKSPFVLRLQRPDGHKELRSLDVRLPEGLTASLSGIPYCHEAGIARAEGRDRSGQGAWERRNPSCPEASRVGRTVVGAGAGPRPLHVEGNAYLAGPYEGAPLSLVFIVPAIAGPFDLGVEVVRTALHVDPRTAEIRAVSDDLPEVIGGIPLRIRDVRVVMDREGFSLNPTSCSPKQVAATIRSTDSTSRSLTSRFQVGDCGALGFEPRFGMQILNPGRRSTLRSFNPAVRFSVEPRPGDANLGPTQVILPSQVILDQSNIRTICTRAQFAADNCPEAAIYGFARAESPLLDEPLTGPVYLGSSDNPLPDLIADLRGQVRIVLQGEILGTRDGRIKNVFRSVPDVPVKRFDLTMFGGRDRGVLVNSQDLCRTRERGVAGFRAANGRLSIQRPPLGLRFQGCGRVLRQEARKRAARRAAIRQAVREGRLTPAQVRRAVRS